ncbi:protein involved in polysaccharide export with SLBB domain [Idiomarina aquatica]|uniref:Protein involved in polysaccharide export with SLBB domain n=1 Tax=Idiomarina aquatica TaxID=1327752 RepID=A0A4R6PSX1_9GAMM|nr:SLBB domain-containing protein [Idiomarina aquatica]TDP40227.1 protein involved in polysaccharide export with SLBB domain [Idiomarina aquatica]
MAGIKATFIKTITAAGLLLSSALAFAQSMPNLTPEQIEQFQNLPPAQQQLIARQYGIDLEQLRQQQMQQQQQQEDTQTNIYPRGTQFDEMGNPIFPTEIKNLFEQEDQELKRFGADLFANEPRSYTPVKDIPIPAHYLVGPGDVINVVLFGKQDNKYELEVTQDGSILIPKLGPVQVAGLTYTETKDVVRARIKEQMIGVEAAVSLGELRAIQVFVVGEAYRPGSYTISSLSTITQALVAAGGVSEIGSVRDIQIKRAGKTVVSFDLYDLLIDGNAVDDLVLQSGDVVHIPPVDQLVTVKGDVVRPAIYELKGEKSLQQVLALAGGMKASAFKEQVIIERVAQSDRQLLTANYATEAGRNQAVMDGDIIDVKTTAGVPSNSVTLVGAVTRPGNYAWYDGFSINDLIRSVNMDLLPEADLSYGIVVRESNAQRDIEVLQFDLAKAISQPNSDADIALSPRDFVVVFSSYEQQSESELTINKLTLTEEEREQEKRLELMKQYEMHFVQQLMVDEQSEAERQAELERQRESLSSLFVQGEQNEQEEVEYTEFSRHRLLEPILMKLRSQSRLGSTAQLVFVDGEVRYPGIYPLPINGNVKDLVLAAGGLKESAYLKRAEISRVEIMGEEADVDYVTFNLANAMAGDIDQALQGRDRLNILRIPQWQENYQVEIGGEVRFPGSYSIRRGDTLSELIERAGGLTDYAMVEGAVFTREVIKEQERERMRRLARDLQHEVVTNSITNTTQANNLSYNEMRNLLRDLTSVDPVGRMVIDLPSILANRADQDIQLRDGDYLHVPTQQNSINIIGEVQFASAHRYKDGMTVDDYIRMSGGLKGKADEERIYVIKADGSVQQRESSWFAVTHSQLEPGDTIVVPLDAQYIDNLNLWTSATQIVYQISVAIAAIAGL